MGDAAATIQNVLSSIDAILHGRFHPVRLESQRTAAV